MYHKRNQLTERDTDHPDFSYSFLWVSSRRDVAHALLAACERTGGDAYWKPRGPRLVQGRWVPPRWVVSCRSISLQEMTALERIADRLDPTSVRRGGSIA